MHILHVNNIAVHFAGRELYRDLSWTLDDRDRVGLVGPNGAGKSTLLKLLLGDIEPDQGNIARQKGIRLGYLPQDIELPPDKTLIETAMIKPKELIAAEARLNAIETQLADPEVYGAERQLTNVLEKHEAQLAVYESMNGHRHARHVKELLAMLGFQQENYDLPTASLSGGQKKMLALARLAVAAPDILLLDEPDNHLDVVGKGHLERFILNYRSAVVIISHDRYFLDQTVDRVVEIREGELRSYAGGYTEYLEAVGQA